MPESDIMDLLAEAEAAAAPTTYSLDELSQAILRMRELESAKAELDNQSAEVGRQIAALAEKEIPLLMQRLKFRELELTDGKKLVLQTTYVGKIPEDKRDAAYGWLEDNGYGGLVKTAVEAQFGMGDLDKAKALAAMLREQGYVVNAERSVHSGSLGKFVKERMTGQLPVPADLFTPNVLIRAKVK